MATPTRAELRTQLQAITHIHEEIRKFGEQNTDNFVGLENTLVQALESDFGSNILAAVASTRASLATMRTGMGPALEAHFRDWMRLINVPDQGLDANISELIDDWNLPANNERVKSRDFTFGTITAGGSNIGDGVIKRLTVNEDNFALENQTPEAKEAEVISDANSGAANKSEEIFRFKGSDASADNVETEGSGETKDITAISPRGTKSLLLNASFDERGGTDAKPTSITSWTSDVAIIGDGTDFTFETTAANVYLPAPNDATTVRALRIKLDRTLTQKINVRRTTLDRNKAYYLQVAWNRTIGTGVGTLNLKLGSQTATVAVSAAQSGWQTLSLPLDQNSWFRNFNQEDLSIVVDWVKTSGDLVVDDVFFVEVDDFGGGGYVAVPARTPFLESDIFTWTDTAVESVIQRAIVELTGRFVPHSTAATLITIADP